MGVLRVFEPIVGKSKGRSMNTDGGPMGFSMGVMELRMVALWWGPIHLRRRGWRWKIGRASCRERVCSTV